MWLPFDKFEITPNPPKKIYVCVCVCACLSEESDRLAQRPTLRSDAAGPSKTLLAATSSS